MRSKSWVDICLLNDAWHHLNCVILNLHTETLVQGLWLYLDEEKQTAGDMPRFRTKARSREDISESFFPSLESKTISTDTLILELQTPQQEENIFL